MYKFIEISFKRLLGSQMYIYVSIKLHQELITIHLNRILKNSLFISLTHSSKLSLNDKIKNETKKWKKRTYLAMLCVV